MTTFTLQAALSTLERSISDAAAAAHNALEFEKAEIASQARADIAILRDLRERLAGAYVGVLREEIPGKLVFEPDGAGQRVIVMKVEE